VVIPGLIAGVIYAGIAAATGASPVPAIIGALLVAAVAIAIGCQSTRRAWFGNLRQSVGDSRTCDSAGEGRVIQSI
jgi:TRAP-type mannitol/chloroaromatic compound transport system permease large subunit